MNLSCRDQNILVSRLRVTTRDTDAAAVRLRLGRLLHGMNLHPAGVAPRQILCVRRLRHPLQRSLILQPDVLRPPATWKAAMDALLEEIARSALRPIAGVVPTGANAVLFYDRSELLACLASDWSEKMVWERWWWRSLFSCSDVKKVVLDACLEAPEYVPAAFEKLSSMGKAASFAAKFDAAASKLLLSVLVEKFALQQVSTALAGVLGGECPKKAVGSRSDEVADQMEKVRSPAPPWKQWVWENFDGRVALEQHCLLGVSLTLARAPAFARSPDFADSLLRWGLGRIQNVADRQLTTITTRPKDKLSSSEVRLDPLLSEIRNANETRDPPAGPVPPNSMLFQQSKLDQRRGPLETGAASAIAHESQNDSGLLVEITSSIRGHQPNGVETHNHELMADPIVPSSPVPLAEPLSVPDAGPDIFLPVNDATIDTELGGLFYLVNIGIFLGLYSDFTRPLDPGLSLLIWDFVVLTGRELLGENAREDPLWQILAQLAGRCEHKTPGTDFDPPDHWRLPADWLAPFPEHGVWRWTVAKRRIQVRHPQGFLVMDRPLLHCDPMTQLMRATEEYREISHFDLEPVTSDSPSLDKLPLDRWLGWIMPYLRARLSCALGLAAGTDITGVLCRQKARVSVTPSHVDIFFTLDQHPIEIRLAGLDRNPGWVPAAGRFIAFHYQ